MPSALRPTRDGDQPPQAGKVYGILRRDVPAPLGCHLHYRGGPVEFKRAEWSPPARPVS